VTSPGFGVNPQIIHTVGPRYHRDSDPPANLARALTSALRLADANGIQRIAVPAISMGVYGYPSAQAVPLLIDTAFRLMPEFSHLLEIRFVVVDRGLYDLRVEEIGGGHAAS
jgi:O-acetyl-ADP-ribose deacetylase